MTDLCNLMKEHQKHTSRRVMSKFDIRRTLKDSQATTLLTLLVIDIFGYWHCCLLTLLALQSGVKGARHCLSLYCSNLFKRKCLPANAYTPLPEHHLLSEVSLCEVASLATSKHEYLDTLF